MFPAIGAQGAPFARGWLASAAISALLLTPGMALAQTFGLQDTLARAAALDPLRAGAEARVQAAEAAARQAAVRPNPRVGLDIENFAGAGQRELVEAAESTLYYEQTLERGGKREARADAARVEIAIARLRARVHSLDHLAAVQTLWIDAAAAEAAIQVAEERLAVAQRLERETARRVAAARDPLFAGERARTDVAQARLALDQARAASANARAALSAYVGAPVSGLDLKDFEATRDDAATTGATSADLALLEAQRDAALARVRVEQGRAVQDPTVRAGLRHFQQGGDVAFVVGGSIPLGRHDSNRGGVDRARAERLAAEADIAAAQAEREREIARLVARRRAAASEAARIEADVLPSAERAVSLVRDGFSRGGGAFTYMEVAEAQRAVIDARGRRIDLLKAFHLDGVRLDRLTGRHAPLLAQAENR